MISEQIERWVAPSSSVAPWPTGDGLAFARIWYALFFDQIALAGEKNLAMSAEDWRRALEVLADAMVRQD
ncbi:MAG: hypothetical protein ACP5OV_02950 [Acidimicrobiales bacterium]